MSERGMRWLETTRKKSSLIESYINSLVLDDTSAWGARLRLVAKQPLRNRKSGVLLAGEQGCGKHTAAEHLIQELLEQEYQLLYLSGQSAGVPSEEVQEWLDLILDDFYEQEHGLCLVVDRPEAFPNCPELLEALGCAAAENWMGVSSEQSPPLFLVLLSEAELKLPFLLSERIHLCRMTHPDLSQRRRCLSAWGRGLEDYLSLEELIQLTEGLNCAQLKNVTELLLVAVEEDFHSFSRAELASFVDSQRSPVSPGRQKEQLTQRLNQLLEQLPSLLQGMSFSGGGQMIQQSSAEEHSENTISALDDQAAFLDEESKRSMEMPVAQLASEVFGEERWENLRKTAKERARV